MGKNIVYLTSCHSTNDIATHKVRSGLAENGEIVIADEQTAGRGLQGNTWVSRKGANLMFSIVLKPENLRVADQFRLSQCIALGVAGFVASVASQGVSVKWPNDVLIGKQKVAGILIENTIRGHMIAYSVVGIGLNVNEVGFDNPRTTSLAAATGLAFDLAEQLGDLLCFIEESLAVLPSGDWQALDARYLDRLFGMNETREFIAGGQVFSGIPSGITPEGRLIIFTGSGERIFDIKEVSWVL